MPDMTGSDVPNTLHATRVSESTKRSSVIFDQIILNLPLFHAHKLTQILANHAVLDLTLVVPYANTRTESMVHSGTSVMTVLYQGPMDYDNP